LRVIIIVSVLLFADFVNFVLFPTDYTGSTYYPPIPLRPTGTQSLMILKRNKNLFGLKTALLIVIVVVAFVHICK
jgi:hypothetical protein